MNDKTIVYITSNGDYDVLEHEVRETIRAHAAGIPIVSVSHKPLDFGDNICVGDIGRHRHNIWKQLRLGAERAQSRFLVICEADFLYPPEFFAFTPENDSTYYYPREGYILWRRNRSFFRKRLDQLSGIVARKHFLKLLDQIQAEDVHEVGRAFNFVRFMRRATVQEQYEGGPVVTLKTDKQMHSKSPHLRDRRRRLPIWGRASEVWDKYKCE